jgi:hypothetical protein
VDLIDQLFNSNEKWLARLHNGNIEVHRTLNAVLCDKPQLEEVTSHSNKLPCIKAREQRLPRMNSDLGHSLPSTPLKTLTSVDYESVRQGV